MLPSPHRSRPGEPHRVADGIQRLPDDRPHPFAPLPEDLPDEPRLGGKLEPSFADRPELLDQSVSEVRLAVDATELARATVVARPVDDVGREARVQREDRTDLRSPWVTESDLLWVRDERTDLRTD